MLNDNRSFGKQLVSYIGNPKDIVGAIPGLVAFFVPVIIVILLGLVGRGEIPGGAGLFHLGILLLTGALVIAAVLALGDEGHKQGNEDIAPTFALVAIAVSLALAILTFYKDTGHFAGVLGG